MSDTVARLQISSHKNIQIAEFTESRILDELNINEIGQTLEELLKSHERPRLLLDFSNVDHLSSAALAMFITVNNLVKQLNGQLRMCHIRPQILEVFVITRLNRLFKILSTREEAIAAFE
jgi:anti-sigma B factor antagonist